jgi:hypothetical protein
MLTGIHFILTYACNFECDHCFLYCRPDAKGTFTIQQITDVLNEGHKLGTVEWIFLEGGEPFLFYPLLTESIKRARDMNFKVGVVTNAYGASSHADAELWLRPLADAGLNSLSISNDTFHYGEEVENPATIAYIVATEIGIATSSICIDPPEILHPAADAGGKGQPVVGGGAKFRGRAVDKLTTDLPVRPWKELCTCPYEDLDSPSRVHVDAYGNVMVCQGISIGNIWRTGLAEIVQTYRSSVHPICGPLLKGGPAALAQAVAASPEKGYVDECHFCYSVRRAKLKNYPDDLAPQQVYGL